MTLCPACRRANPAGARFCSNCGNALEGGGELALEERKVVTVLFADLVGFTSRAEQMDPEEVRAVLSPFYTRLRAELERFGGTVEKFIGDAVMALFGAPVAHEDDPERAVRAALAIRDWVRQEGRIQVRIAINTGEALVVLGARPVEGEGMAAGDVVNTAARLQTAAPVNGILVGERTYRATRQVIEYREGAPVSAKGKVEPLTVWEAVGASAPVGAGPWRAAPTPLFGRHRELNLLHAALVRLSAERGAQLITVVGVPGIGKSRLLGELSRAAGAEAPSVAWRQGRSLPYDSGAGFRALADVVRAEAGILDTDSAAEADQKLTRMTAEVVPDASDWVGRHLGVLIGGVRRDGEATAAHRYEEIFAAWRRFFEALAERNPLVLIFEDLHWADDGLLDFIDYLVDWAGEVPMLVVCSARPELLERRPGWGGGKPNAIMLSLGPLSDDDTNALIASLAGAPSLDPARQTQLLARAGGNPLYAEQYVQMLAQDGGDDGLPPPDSIQAIIAARLDGLPPAEKRLVQDAAVVGKVFWPPAVSALGEVVGRPPWEEEGPPARLEESLHRLERKQFIRRDRGSSLVGHRQYAFLHVLLRDVAYGQIPRPARIDKHLRAAGWIEAFARPEEQAEMLAPHYLAAVDLARAARRDTADLAPRARTVLRSAGDRAHELNASEAAARFYRAALGLWPDEAVDERTDLLFRLAVAMFRAGDDAQESALDSALAALLAAGDRTRAALVETHIGDVWFLRGDQDRYLQHLEAAYELVRDEPASPQKVEVLAARARHLMLAGSLDGESARQALRLAEALGLDEQQAQLLITIGTGRWLEGDPSGREDIERGLEIVRSGNYLRTARRAYVNLAACAYDEADLREAIRLCREAEGLAQRLGNREDVRWDRATLTALLFESGDWDECADVVDELARDFGRSVSHYLDSTVRLARARLRMARDDVRGALEDQAAALTGARPARDPQVLWPALCMSAYLLAEVGHLQEGGLLLDEVVATDAHGIGNLLSGAVMDLALAAERLGRTRAVTHWLSRSPGTQWSAAATALLDRRHDHAIALLESSGAVRAECLVRLRAAEVLTGTGRYGEAEDTLRPALGFFRSVGATRFIRQAEGVLIAPA